MVEDPLLACAARTPASQFDSSPPLTPPGDESENKQLQLAPELPLSPEVLPEEGEDFDLEPLEPINVTKEPNLVLHAKVYAIADK